MQIITLYRYKREGGGITVSPEKPDCEYTTLFRLVADEGMVLSKGDVIAECIDTVDVEEWVEIEAPVIETDEEE